MTVFHRISLFLAFILSAVLWAGQTLQAETNWNAGSGEFANLQDAGNYDNGSPANTNPGVISDVTLTLTATPDYNSKTFRVSNSQIRVVNASESKFSLSSSGTSVSTLELSNASTLTCGRIWATWSGNTTANFTLNDTSAIHLSGFFNVHNAAQAGTGTCKVTLNGTSVIDGIVDFNVNGDFVLNGTGTMTAAKLYNNGTMTLNGAALSIGYNDTSYTGTIKLAGGTLAVTGNVVLASNIEIADGKTSTFALADTKDLYLNGNLTGSGILNRTGTSNTLFLHGDNSGFSGTLNAAGSNTYITAATGGSANAVWNITETLAAQGLTTGSIQLGAVTGSGTLRNDTAGLVTFDVGGKNTNEIFTGTIQDDSNGLSATKQLAINKVGTGSWTLSGTNNFSGGTTVSNGRLNIDGNLNGTLSVAGGYLSPGLDGESGRSLVGTVNVSDAVTVGSDGTLLINMDSTGLDVLNAQSVLFEDGASIQFEAAASAVVLPDTGYAFLTTTDALPEMDWNSLLLGDSVHSWSIYAAGNTLYVSTVVPEPSSVLLLLLGIGLIFRNVQKRL